MKQQKMIEYRSGYPRKVLRGAALTAAALVGLGVSTGCRKAPAPELQTEGLVAVPEPTEEVLVLDGEVAIPEPTEEPALQDKIMVTEPPEEELMLDGEVAICKPAPTAASRELTTTGMIYVPEENGQN